MPIPLTQAFELIRDTLDSMQSTGLMAKDVGIREDLVLLGAGSPLDSIAFVTFVTEIEDRLSQAESQDYFLVLKDIQSFNAGHTTLSVGTLAKYLVKLTGGVE